MPFLTSSNANNICEEMEKMMGIILKQGSVPVNLLQMLFALILYLSDHNLLLTFLG